MPTEQLVELFNAINDFTAAAFGLMGRVWELFVKRGVDLRQFRDNTCTQFLTRIADGRTLPDALHKFGPTRVRDRVIKLSIPEQARLVKDSQVEVVERLPTGELTPRKHPIESLQKPQLDLVIDRSSCPYRIRSEDEQRAILTAPASTPPTPPPAEGTVEISRGGGDVWVTINGRVRVKTLVSTLRARGQLPGD